VGYLLSKRTEKYQCQRMKGHLYRDVAHENLIYSYRSGNIVSSENEIDVISERTVYKGK
jgi:hypothetical protein